MKLIACPCRISLLAMSHFVGKEMRYPKKAHASTLLRPSIRHCSHLVSTKESEPGGGAAIMGPRCCCTHSFSCFNIIKGIY